jgi:two-component system, OmpR family, sensor histidine kinase KdpD
MPVTLLSARRRGAGWAMAMIGPAALSAVLVPSTDASTLSAESMGFLALTVACAIVGGLWPALTAAVLSTGLLNWFFTPPTRTLTIERTADLVVLVLFLLVASAVSSVVGHAARRSLQAAEARREADALIRLNRTVLTSSQDLSSLLNLVCDTFGSRSASLFSADQAGPSRLAAVGQDAPLDPSEADEVAEVRPSSPPLLLALRGAPLSPSDRRVLASFAGHLAVVLERRKLAAEAARSRRLEEGNRVRSALLAAVSHDLRTPLARAKAAVSSLRSPDVSWSRDDELELLATIEDSTDRLHAILSNLLDLSRIQSDAVVPATQEVGLEDVVARALDSTADSARVEIRALPELPQVRTDAGLLERVVANLVDNALRHAPQGMPVVVSLSGDEETVRVAVIDRGPGVSDEGKEQMFGAFRRLGDAEAREGLGLGLAVARGLTEAMGGRLTPHDTPGGGLTMVVDLPAAVGHAPSGIARGQ